MGDQEEKLAEGIKLYGIPTTTTSKRTILSDLITVWCGFLFIDIVFIHVMQYSKQFLILIGY